jgi:trimeric autotransporter adhesin
MRTATLRKVFYAGFLAFACGAATTSSAQGIINTIAGTGIAGFSGDGGPAISAQFSSPFGVAVDASGNIYIADKSNHRVRKISAASGTISTFAGSDYGLAGLGGPAELALMRYPDGVYVNLLGDVLITDWYNDMTFAVDHATGIISSRCGNGHQGHGGDGGPGHHATMMTPSGSCEDNMGNTYIADGSNRIRRVDALTGIVTTIANGTGAYGYTGDGGPAIDARFARPTAVIFDPASPGLGHLYVSDGNNNVVRKIDLNTNIITTVAGTGVAGYSGNGYIATLAQLRNPGNLFIDSHRNLFICDRGNNTVRKLLLNRGVIFGVAGNTSMGFAGDGGHSLDAKLNDPEGVWVDAMDRIYIADAGNQRIRMIVPGGTYGGTEPTTPKPIGSLNSSIGADEILVFPNPSNGMFNIQLGENNTDATISVFNVVGELVYNSAITSTNAEINLSNRAPGIYTAIVKSAAGTKTQKLTIQ